MGTQKTSETKTLGNAIEADPWTGFTVLEKVAQRVRLMRTPRANGARLLTSSCDVYGILTGGTFKCRNPQESPRQEVGGRNRSQETGDGLWIDGERSAKKCDLNVGDELIWCKTALQVADALTMNRWPRAIWRRCCGNACCALPLSSECKDWRFVAGNSPIRYSSGRTEGHADMQIRRMWTYSLYCSTSPWSAWCMSSFGFEPDRAFELKRWKGTASFKLVLRFC